MNNSAIVSGDFHLHQFSKRFQNRLPDFLLGLPEIAQTSLGIPRADARATVFSLYLGDDRKVNRRLTVNLGVRYELDQHRCKFAELRGRHISCRSPDHPVWT